MRVWACRLFAVLIIPVLSPVSTQDHGLSALGKVAVAAEISEQRRAAPGTAAALPARDDLQAFVPFRSSPFPYAGNVPTTGKPFLDVSGANGRLGHNAPRGGVYWADQTYSDRNVLLYIPKRFDPRRPGVIVVFFHGNHAILERDVAPPHRQGIPHQLAASGLNAVLVAPQFAVDANDSSAGNFWNPGAFDKFLREAAQRLALLYGDARAEACFGAMKIVLVAYSGGYNPAAYALTVGGADRRILGVVLLDALVGETDKFAAWIGRQQPAFFFSAYSDASRRENLALQQILRERNIAFGRALPPSLQPATISFFAAGRVRHEDFVSLPWGPGPEPLAGLLKRIPAVGHTGAADCTAAGAPRGDPRPASHGPKGSPANR